MPVKRVIVPDLDGPEVELCWKQYNPTVPPFTRAMERCDRRKGHGGLHTWQMANRIDELQAAAPAR